jgi:hypothetical protein
MSVRTTRITIETEELLIACLGRTMNTWCPGCGAEIPAIFVDDATQIAGTVALLPAGTHVWTADAGTFICLPSLSQLCRADRSQQQGTTDRKLTTEGEGK